MPEPVNAEEEYRARIAALTEQQQRLAGRDRSFIAGKAASGVLFVALGIWLARYDRAAIAWTLVPVLCFVVLAIAHERLLKQMQSVRRLLRMYEKGLSRVEDRWKDETDGDWVTGERFLLEDDRARQHPYARDLDLFGAGGLYHLLCDARTGSGQRTLADWLLVPAKEKEIRRRQQAIAELVPMLELREQLSLAGDTLRKKVEESRVDPGELAQWGRGPAGIDPRLRLALLLLAGAWIASLVLWRLYGFGAIAFVLSAANLAIAYRKRTQVRLAAMQIEHAAAEIGVLAAMLKRIERQPFGAEKLIQLQSVLQNSHRGAANALSDLSRCLDWLDSADNWFDKLIDGFVFYKIQTLIRIEAWRKVHGPAIGAWLEVIGQIEALSSLATYKFEHTDTVFPELIETETAFCAEALAHPLLARTGIVSNDVRLGAGLQLMLISGPNMAGKSTFIRSVGLNAVLAMAGAPVRAGSLRMGRMQVAASICILDSLQGGLSRFYAEVLRLKAIDQMTREGAPVLFLLDELLAGTNAKDRRVGCESLMKSWLSRGALGVITTHDLALAAMADEMRGLASNFHFEDRYEAEALHFDYLLKPGIVETSNALQLMRSVGLAV